MASAAEFTRVSAGVYTWQAYDPSVKADLCSSAIITSRGIILVDPILLEEGPHQELTSQRSVVGIVVTNDNHDRASQQYSDRCAAPVFGGAGSQTQGWKPLSELEVFCPEVKCIALPGAPAGETAIHSESDGGTLVIGDALINFEPHGFTFLPKKYCRDARLMRESLRRLLDHRFERILFAHGTPIVADAHERLERLLAGAS